MVLQLQRHLLHAKMRFVQFRLHTFIDTYSYIHRKKIKKHCLTHDIVKVHPILSEHWRLMWLFHRHKLYKPTSRLVQGGINKIDKNYGRRSLSHALISTGHHLLVGSDITLGIRGTKTNSHPCFIHKITPWLIFTLWRDEKGIYKLHWYIIL